MGGVEIQRASTLKNFNSNAPLSSATSPVKLRSI